MKCEVKCYVAGQVFTVECYAANYNDERNSFVELRAGAGGDEAAIFVGDLYRMYGRFAERNKWKVEKIKEIPSGRIQSGKKDGQWVQWYRNGQKEVEGVYYRGKKHGLWKTRRS